MFFILLMSETLMFHCSFVDDSLERHVWSIDNFDAIFFDLYCFCCVKLWITDVSLLLHRWFVDGSSKNHWSYSKDFVAKIKDHKCFFLTWSPKHWWSLLRCRGSLMIFWRDISETLIISVATFLILIVFLC